jgi:hypothetical protein
MREGKGFDGEACTVMRRPLLSPMFNEDILMNTSRPLSGQGPAVDSFRYFTQTYTYHALTVQTEDFVLTSVDNG